MQHLLTILKQSFQAMLKIQLKVHHSFVSAALWALLLSSCGSYSAVNNLTKVQTSTKLHTPTSPMPESFYHASPEQLKANFKTPPDAVKPWVYWYWINDHISKTGIERDLAAMQKAGISTALIGIIHLKPSIGGYGEVNALSDEWWQHIQFAIEKAEQYNIDIGLFNSPGWSQSGGPWVNKAQSMRYLDAKEYQVQGASSAPITLEKPDGFSQNVKVIAFKTPKQEQFRLNNQQTTIKVSGLDKQTLSSQTDTKTLIDGKQESIYFLPINTPSNQKRGEDRVQIDFTHQHALTARTLEIYPHQAFSAKAVLAYKNNQGAFEDLKTFTIHRPRSKAAIGPDHDAPIVVNFPAVTTNAYRLTLSEFQRHNKQPDDHIGIKEVVLSSGYKLERYVEKKLAKVHPTPQPKHDSYMWPEPLAADNKELTLSADEILDITKFVDGEQLNWQVPDGQWTIVHYFMRPTGTTNGPSSKNARGPEIDKLSKAIAQFHFDAYIGKVLKNIKPEQRRALKYVVVDSYEQGAQNWTDDFAIKFQQQYGYDPIPFLPVYTGRIVNSATESERFLWDVRRMVADKVAYQYTAGLRERAHQHGLKLWLENYGHWGFPGEFLQYGGQADIVSGEFWASGNLGAIELKAASSAAHIYGHKTVMSESFTAGRSDAFKNHPWNFKKRGDWSFVEGINHTLLHVYIQQAYEDKFPGVNAWFGSEFNRHNTWFDYMGSWLTYVKRANYMMQQGQYVADIMYFIGEDSPKMTGELKPAVPHGYSYDYINAEVLLNRVTVKEGKFHLPNGATFKLLVLPNINKMRPEVLKKISNLVASGGVIYGPKPTQSPSLKNYPYADQQIIKLANNLWQKIDGSAITHVNYGKGHVFYSANQDVDLAKILKQVNSQPDLSNLPSSVIWSHRSSDTHEIYFIANQSETETTINPSFSALNNIGSPQRWNAITGNTELIAQYQKQAKRITFPISLQGLESVFIVFEKNTTEPPLITVDNISTLTTSDKVKQNILLPSVINHQGNIVVSVSDNNNYQVQLNNGALHNINVTDLSEVKTLKQPWHLTFDAKRDVPTALTLNKLVSLTQLTSVALKHYSGSITYQTEFNFDANLLRADQSWLLDLGEVGVIARVTVNNKNLGEVWSRPLKIDITEALKAGKNQLKIEVATTWVNRLVGDLTYPDKFPDSPNIKNFTTEHTYESTISKETPLQPAGLIGPVQLKAVRNITIPINPK